MSYIKVELSRGMFALVDEIDSWVLNYKWIAHNSRGGVFYAERSNSGQPHTIKMHRAIAEKMFGDQTSHKEIDHINRNGLDNRRSNLRLASRSANRANSTSTDRGNKTSIYKGVSWNKPSRSWKAQIYKNRHAVSIGYFRTERAAAIAYDQAAFEIWGEFAYLNFPDEIRGNKIKAAIT